MTTAHTDLPSSAQPPDGPPPDGLRPVVRISSPPEICDAVPYLVGFEPAQSIVVISLRGERKRIGVVMRVDLPPPRQARALAEMLVGHLRTDTAAAAVFIVYTDASAAAGSTAKRIARALLQELKLAGIPVAEGLRVSDRRWTSYTCHRPCCPPTGTPMPDRTAEPSVFGTAMIADGRSVLGSRAELEDTLDPVTGPVATSMVKALIAQVPWPTFESVMRDEADKAADGDGAGQRASASKDLPAYAVATIDLAVEWSHRLEDPRESITVAAAARLLIGLTDRAVRDRLLPWTIPDQELAPLGPAATELWTALVRRAVLPGLAAAPATLLGWYCYLRDGAGALANIAVERALDDNPDYVMAGYLLSVLQEGVPPATLTQWLSTGERVSPGPDTSAKT